MKYIAIFIVILTMGACSPVVKMMIGYKNPAPMTEQNIQKWGKKAGVSGLPLYSLDTTYTTYLHSIYNIKNSLHRKNLNQFMMVMYFRNDSLVSLVNNCLFSGFPNINWDSYGTFDSFPPKNHYSDTLFNKMRLQMLAKYLNPVADTKEISAGKDYLLVFGNHVFNRQSKRLIKLISKRYSNNKSQIIYINNDNFIYYKMDKTW